MAVCRVILRGQQTYTVIQAVHSLLYIVAKCNFFSVVTWKDIIQYLQTCEGCTHFCEILYLSIHPSIHPSQPLSIDLLHLLCWEFNSQMPLFCPGHHDWWYWHKYKNMKEKTECVSCSIIVTILYCTVLYYTILYFCCDLLLILHKRERIERIRDQGGQIVSVRHQKSVSFWPLRIDTVLSSLTHNQCSNDKGVYNLCSIHGAQGGSYLCSMTSAAGKNDQFRSPAAAAFYANVINSSAPLRHTSVSQGSEELMNGCRTFN